MKDIEDINGIKIFVDEFYASVQKDTLIGPIFNSVITSWDVHLQKMYAFWNAALFGVPGFKGNPFAKHAPLHLEPPHFKRWLELFNETIDRNFEGPLATDTKTRAGLMAVMFQNKIARTGGDASLTIV